MRNRMPIKKVKDLPDCDRPREKIRDKGARALTTRELIAALLGRGTRGHEVASLARDIERLIGEKPDAVTYPSLCSLHGMGPSKASQVLAALELGRRYFGQEGNDRIRITRPEDLLPCIAGIRTKRQEYFLCTTLNGAGEVIGTRTITVGLLNHSLVHPREVFADAIADRAASVILAHNHPSGVLEPSPQDIAITGQICRAGELLGIPVLDHIIVSAGGFLSMKERGLLG
jgi:DNA repair protein RadC